MIHRDLKPANILISVEGIAKLADFGTAFDLNLLTHTVKQTLCGTPAFMGPEVVNCEPHTTASDIWSFGGILFEMLAGAMAFAQYDKRQLLRQLANDTLTLAWPEIAVPVTARQMVEACMAHTPQDRPSATDASRHTFLTIAPKAPTCLPDPVSQAEVERWLTRCSQEPSNAKPTRCSEELKPQAMARSTL